jgi:hypothetical protein
MLVARGRATAAARHRCSRCSISGLVRSAQPAPLPPKLPKSPGSLPGAAKATHPSTARMMQQQHTRPRTPPPKAAAAAEQQRIPGLATATALSGAATATAAATATGTAVAATTTIGALSQKLAQLAAPLRPKLTSLFSSMTRERVLVHIPPVVPAVSPLTVRTNMSNLCGHGSFLLLAMAYLESDVLLLRVFSAGGIALSVLFQVRPALPQLLCVLALLQLPPLVERRCAA